MKKDFKIPSSYKYGFSKPDRSVFRSQRGLSKKLIEEISSQKGEPEWMRKWRLQSLEHFLARPLLTWGPDLSQIDFANIVYYVKPTEKIAKKWDDVPEEIKETYVRLGVPQAERKFFAGVGAQYDSEVVYHRLQKRLKKLGVIFMDTDSALKKYPELFQEHFGKVVPMNDNKFALLNSAVWSGGSFVYIPKGVKVDIPLQAYFRINAKNMGQFERTLIIADEGSSVHYIEGCTAPQYSSDSLHVAVVEVIAKPYSHIRYTTVQNWSNNVYNLVTKRARAEEGAFVEWVDGNLGSKITMKYPSVYLYGRGSRADILSIAMAGKGQIQDAGAKVFHLAPETSSHIVSKSVSFDGGVTNYRGLVKVIPGAKNSRVSVRCDALLLDRESVSQTYPTMNVMEEDVRVEHEATVSRLGAKELFYLKSRGFSENDAVSLLIAGFMEPFAKQLPGDYAIELNRLIEMEMEGSVG